MIHKLPLGDKLLRIATALGMACSAYLLYLSLSTDSLAGCGAADCGDVIASRWGKVFYVPVSLLGFVLYAIWSIVEWRGKKPWRGWFAGTILGSVVWFLSIQMFLLKQICPACLVSHAVGLFAAVVAIRFQPASIRPALASASLAVVFLGLAQVYGPVPRSHVVERTGRVGAAPPPEVVPGKTVWEKTGLGLSEELHPVIGNRDADRFLVLLFDYQCLECRRVSKYLDDTMADYPDSFAAILLPVPLEKSCNPKLTAATKDQRGACTISKSALVVWRLRPTAFEGYHRQIMKDPGADQARDSAIRILGEEAYEAGLRDLEETTEGMPFRRNLELWEEFSAGKTGRLPKIWFNDLMLLHGAPSSGKMFFEVINSQFRFE